MRRGRRVIICSALAALAYLAVALWNFRVVLPEPSVLLPETPQSSVEYAQLGRLDLTMVVWNVTGNAERLVERPWQLRAEGQCHPLPRAYTLGEHMLGEGLLAAGPLALSGDPILSYNVLLLATVWIAALAMYALALHFTRSPAAAFVAGLLFCLEPAHIRDSAHPFVHGDLWAPLALLFLHRLFARGGLGNALACAFFFALTALESLYALLGVFLITAAYGFYAAFRHRHLVGRWLAPLLASALLAGGVAFVVLRPYLITRATWEVLVRPGTMFLPLSGLAPGQASFPGWVSLVLVLAGLADRVRRRRDEEGEDPRLAFLAGALLVLWCSVRTIPLAGIEIPSPFLLLKDHVPGLDAVRGLWTVGRSAVLGSALIAGYAVLAAGDWLGARRTPLVAALLSCALLAERYVPAISAATFGVAHEYAAYRARPPEEDIALLRRHARGAILDLPHPRGDGRMLAAGSYLLLESYRPRPTAACYNSFPSPLDERVAELANALPRPEAADALAALGFATVLLRTDRMRPARIEAFAEQVATDPQVAARLALLGRTERLIAYRLQSPAPLGDDIAQLAAHGPPRRRQRRPRRPERDRARAPQRLRADLGATRADRPDAHRGALARRVRRRRRRRAQPAAAAARARGRARRRRTAAARLPRRAGQI